MTALALGLSLVVAAAASAAADSAPTKVTIAQTSVALGFSVVAIAADEGFFAKEGLDPDIQIVSSGDPQVLASLHSGSAQFGAMTLVPAIQAAARGEKLRLVAPFVSEFVIQFVINPDTATKLGITDDMTLKEKFIRAKGQTIGTLDVGGGLDLMFRSLAKRYGLDADKDFTITAIHSYPGLIAACQRGQIGIALTAIPYGTLGVQRAGLKMFANFWYGAIPEYKGAMHQGMVVDGDYEEQHPDVVRRMHSALDGALIFMHKEPEKAVADLHKRYPSLAEDVIREFIVGDASSFADRAIAPRKGFDIIRDFVAQNLLPQASTIKYDKFVLPYAQEK
jgi:NitT/TauT family transport system substrate-binding protein